MPRSTRPRIIPLPEPKPRKLTWRDHLAAVLRLEPRRRGGRSVLRGLENHPNPFAPAAPLPGVVGAGGARKPPQIAMDAAELFRGAMDNVPSQVGPGWWGPSAASYFASAYEEGQVWLGYAVLVILAQRPEYRTITETFAREMTREWINLKSKSDDKDKQEKIDKINDRLEELDFRAVTKAAITNDGYQGRFQIFVDVGEDDEDLATPIGEGDDATKAKFGKMGGKNIIKRLQAVEPMWCYPGMYNSSNPLSVDWYNPETWWIMGTEVHKTRFLTACASPVPNMLQPAYSFGGLSRTQMAKPYVDFYLRDRTSASDLLNNFSLWVLATDLSVTTMDEGSALAHRIEVAQAMRDNQGIMVISKDSEEADIKSSPLAGVKDLVAQAGEHISAPSRIPIVKYWGDQPSGMNASSEGVIRMFYDDVHAEQEGWLLPPVKRIVDLVQMELFGEVDRDIVIEFPPLWQLDEAGKSAIQKTKSDQRAIDIEAGVILPDEGRKALARDPDSQYSGLDLDTPLPEPDPMELLGLGGGGGEGEGEVPPGTTGPLALRGMSKGAPGIKPSRRDVGSRISSTAASFGSPATGGFGEDEKVSMEYANYTEDGHGDRRCKNCTMFRAPDSCTYVEGDILPEGGCRFFERDDNAADS